MTFAYEKIQKTNKQNKNIFTGFIQTQVPV